MLANDGIDLDLSPGEVHALLGENGAGKSTLASILTGLYRQDAGEIRLGGATVDFRSPKQALKGGIFMVHQHFKLVPSLTVTENVVLGHRSEPWVAGSLRKVEQRLRELAREHGLKVDVGARVLDLSVGERQRVEVLKGLFREPAVLILDEPTALLAPQEAEELLKTLRRACRSDRAILLISHRLKEVLAVADRITVMRRGRCVGTVAASDCDPNILARMMIGRDFPPPTPRSRRAAGSLAPLLELRSVSAKGRPGTPGIRDVSFDVRSGEVLAVAGVSGNGQTLLAEIVAGNRRPSSGQVLIAGVALGGRGAKEALALGVAYIPEDRHGEAVAPDLTVAENLVLRSRSESSFKRFGLISRRRLERHARRLATEFGIAARRLDDPVRLLSGGNIQKTVLARELSNGPRVIVAASPTQGLDVGATRLVHDALERAAADGNSVLLISEDIDEILELADRIVVLYRGAIVGEMPRAAAETEKLGLLMLGAG